MKRRFLIMKATAWRLQTGNKDVFIYRMQIDGLKAQRAINKAYKTFEQENWTMWGEGYNHRNKETMLIFSKRFTNENEWLRWAKSAPLHLVELNRKGKPKPIKLGLNKKRRGRPRKATL